MTIQLPGDVAAVLDRLESQGHEAHIVGGCVRDSLMGREPHDWDVTTSANPNEMLAVLACFRPVETGLKHGTITVFPGGNPVEVTAFRVDGAYSDSRHPDEVQFTRSLAEDLARRDFTVNALAYSPLRGLTDLYGGERDLRARVIRCVGSVDDRLREDALRILRGLRFASVLGFAVEPETAHAILENRALLGGIAAERVFSELTQLLCGENVREVLLRFALVFAEILPELARSIGFDQRNPYHKYDVYEHSARATAAAPPDPVLRLALLLHDCGKPACCTQDANGVRHFYTHPKKSAELALAALTRLRADHETRARVCGLVEYHDYEIQPEERRIRRMLCRFGEEFVFQLIEVKRADNLAQSAFAYRQGKIDQVERMARDILAQQQCFTLRGLAVNGHDLLAAGVPEGEAVGHELHRLLALVVDGELPNTREALLARLNTDTLKEEGG